MTFDGLNNLWNGPHIRVAYPVAPLTASRNPRVKDAALALSRARQQGAAVLKQMVSKSKCAASLEISRRSVLSTVAHHRCRHAKTNHLFNYKLMYSIL